MNYKSLLLIAVLTVSVLAFLSPIAVTYASTGHPTVFDTNYFVTSPPTSPSCADTATTSVGVYSGTMTVVQADSGSSAYMFTGLLGT